MIMIVIRSWRDVMIIDHSNDPISIALMACSFLYCLMSDAGLIFCFYTVGQRTGWLSGL